mmetsp:Transcript_10912/g.45457  ORF Transcript_10912/g.45457 Transcript_10912/m.45457 type:complete len:318 (+) Transcript_10912:1665-2618(+)
MRIVELNRNLLREVLERPPRDDPLLVPPQHVLERRADEEELLLEPQNFPRVGVIARVEHRGYALAPLLRLHGAVVVARVERREVEFVARLGRPEPHVVRVVRAVARNGGIIRHRDDNLAALPPEPGLPRLFVLVRLHLAVQPHEVLDVQTLNLPRVSVREPVVRELHLLAVHEPLLEHAVLVPYAVPPGGIVQRRERVEETRREPAQAAVAQRGLLLLRHDILQIVPQLPQSLGVRTPQPQIAHRVPHRPPHQKLQGKVIHALAVPRSIKLLRVRPPLDEPVPDGMRGGLVERPAVELVPPPRQRVLHVLNERPLNR